MSRTESHPVDNVVPMFRRQPAAPQAVGQADVEREAHELAWRLLDLAERADPAELGYLAYRTMQTANDLVHMAQHLADMAERLSPRDSVDDPQDSGPEIWEIDIAA